MSRRCQDVSIESDQRAATERSTTMASGETHGAESLSEQFGSRWSGSMERYVRTWLDFVFLRPRRFAKRYELRRNRYTRPVVFFVDSRLLAGLGLWAAE